ncbi:hypothetical protein BGW42_000003 [Actinomortierella wolfii]|nr:hypothetical protein BGW42_000003 [Actinomortierella wolfii]
MTTEKSTASSSSSGATLASLPTELLLRIFTLSSNPSLALLSRDFYARIGEASKTSVATRIGFLKVRYRGNWTKMVVKGLRWKFFDLDVLRALDRLYAQTVMKKNERKERKRALKAMEKERLQWAQGPALLPEPTPSSTLSNTNSKKRKMSPSSSLVSTPSNSSRATTVDAPVTSAEDDDEGDGFRQKRMRTVNGETYWRSTSTSSSQAASPYNFFSSNDQAPIPSTSRSMYSYPALTTKSRTASPSSHDGDVAQDAKSSGDNQHGKEKEEGDEEAEEEEIKIPLPSDFPIPRRLFRSSSSSPSTQTGHQEQKQDQGQDNKHIPLVRELLQRGGSATTPANYPMIRSAQRGDLAMIRTLVRYGGAAPDQVALRWACVENHMHVADYFLEGGGYETEEIVVAEIVEGS